MIDKLLAIPLLLIAANLGAAEYFVRLTGDDANDGRAPARAFRTIGRGVAALKSGDTLTIGPGEYPESVTVRDFGSPDVATVIQAEYPGSVLMRGDREITGFRPLENSRFIHVVEHRGPVQAVTEVDSLRIYLPAISLRALEFTRGRYYHDAEAGKLYISTGDGRPPAGRPLTVSTRDHGLRFIRAQNIAVDGLMFRGYHSPNLDKATGEQTAAGLAFLVNSERITVKNCRAFLNTNGILFQQSKNSAVEHCTVYGNGSPFVYEGGNLVFFSSVDCRISDCDSFRPNNPQASGIRFYGGASSGCLIENCRAYDGTAIDLKPILPRSSIVNSYSETFIHAREVAHNVRGRNHNARNADDPTPFTDGLAAEELDRRFAAPERHDFRALPGVPEAVNAPVNAGDVFFLAPGGDDAADGATPATAWRTWRNVKSGSTVYLLPGIHPGGRIAGAGVKVISRSAVRRATVDGELELTGDDLTLRGIDLTAAVALRGDRATVEACVFTAPLRLTGRAARLVRNFFAAAPELGGATGYRHSNLFAPDLPLPAAPGVADLDTAPAAPPQPGPAGAGRLPFRNAAAFAGRGFDGLSQGPAVPAGPPPDELTGPFVYARTATTADIEWWTSAPVTESLLTYGEDRDCAKRAGGRGRPATWHSVTITRLTPGREYFCRVGDRTISFTTLSADAKGRAYHVAVDGDDMASGSASRPLRTIARAGELAGPGDQIIVRGGVYCEEISIRRGGAPGRPLTIRSAPGEQVFLDGDHLAQRLLNAPYKHNLVIDGFYLRNVVNYHSIESAAMLFRGGGGHTVRRCLYDGRAGAHYTPFFIHAHSVRKFTLENSVVVRGFRGARFKHCPDLLVRNNVWYVNQIKHLQIMNLAGQAASFRNNILVDLVPRKYFEPLLEGEDLADFSERDNCLLLRQDPDKRLFISQLYRDRKRAPAAFTYRQYLDAAGREDTAVFGNPRLPILPELTLKFDHAAALRPQGDALEKQMREAELKYDPTDRRYLPLSFRDFFAADPTCRARNIGLETTAFTDDSGFAK